MCQTIISVYKVFFVLPCAAFIKHSEIRDLDEKVLNMLTCSGISMTLLKPLCICTLFCVAICKPMPYEVESVTSGDIGEPALTCSFHRIDIR